MNRGYFILHSHGATCATGETAAEAVRWAWIPGGWQDARAVVAEELVIQPAGAPVTVALGIPMAVKGAQ